MATGRPGASGTAWRGASERAGAGGSDSIASLLGAQWERQAHRRRPRGVARMGPGRGEVGGAALEGRIFTSLGFQPQVGGGLVPGLGWPADRTDRSNQTDRTD